VYHYVRPKLYLVGVAAVAVPAACPGRYGLRGFYEREDKPITLTRHSVDGIHLKGGTMLVSDTLIHSRQPLIIAAPGWCLERHLQRVVASSCHRPEVVDSCC
jgi:hypothetical protein